LEANVLDASLKRQISLKVVEEQSQTIAEMHCQLEANVLDASVKRETLEVVDEQSQTIAELHCQLEATVLDSSAKQAINLEVAEEQSQTIAELHCQLESNFFMHPLRERSFIRSSRSRLKLLLLFVPAHRQLRVLIDRNVSRDLLFSFK
jgi:hypothetical protein